MKLKYIIALIVIAVSVTIIMSTAGDASSYVTFNEASELAQSGDDKNIHVVGTLKKDAQGEVVGVEPSEDKLSVSFMMVDENGREQQVFYNEPMPADLLRSEQVVVIGSYRSDYFVADQVLLKCPSKYQEEEIS
ncbi:cytochrome c maturation protein CcmE domain-containing protein [Tunicatimonas pelagia]|uniref:cytochrome c maturation protein CcmE domain-containing protein n=1 Tax=Tunicatimonas pelagia TaxID=931531 RepID=UPI0026671F36|nr:cytochrome c maturation protein CcmE [Tunicatimonas pelagia]WKN46358.1 cytochrome c maturation protein CcmE [Tunicatimonas pelagia]